MEGGEAGGSAKVAPPPTPAGRGALLGGPAWRGPRTHLQGVPRDDQGAVMLPAEGIQLEVGLAAVGHLEGNTGVWEALLSAEQQTVTSWSRCEDNGHAGQGTRPLPCPSCQIKSCDDSVGTGTARLPPVTLHFPRTAVTRTIKARTKTDCTFFCARPCGQHASQIVPTCCSRGPGRVPDSDSSLHS